MSAPRFHIGQPVVVLADPENDSPEFPAIVRQVEAGDPPTYIVEAGEYRERYGFSEEWLRLPQAPAPRGMAILTGVVPVAEPIP